MTRPGSALLRRLLAVVAVCLFGTCALAPPPVESTGGDRAPVAARADAPRPVPFEASEVRAELDPGWAWLALACYLDPKAPYPPYQLTGRYLLFEEGERPSLRFFPRTGQLLFVWSYAFPTPGGRDGYALDVATLFQRPDRTSYAVLDGEAAGRGWIVRFDCEAFWSGRCEDADVPATGSRTPDGFRVPPAPAPDEPGRCQLEGLASRREALLVVQLFETVFEACGFGSDVAPSAESVEASIPRLQPGEQAVAPSFQREP